MSEAEYRGLLENALVQYDRYRSMYPRDASIVFVVTPNILDILCLKEAESIRKLYEPRSMRTLLKFHGVDVYQIHGSGDEEIFSPAFLWNEGAGEISLTGTLQNGDLLVDGEQVYMYSIEQNGYKEIGYTADAGRATTVASSWNWASDMWSSGMLNPTVMGVDLSYGSSSNVESDYSATFNRFFGGRRKKARAEQELNPGDTKAIDDYLNSFAPKQMLHEA